MTEKKLIQVLKNHNQPHILNHYYALPPAGKRAFLKECGQLDFELTFSLYRESLTGKERSLDLKSMGPAPIVAIPREAAEIARRLEARRVGEALLREGKAGVLIVAGGQGSRLGFNGPKGMFPVSPVRGKTLFRLFCESLKAASLLYGARIPLVIMTSRENDSDTRTYFESNGYFDLDRQDVHFFEQGMAPTITPGGALIVKDETHLFTNPDGHGGSLKGLHDSGLLDHLISRGVSDIFYCQVDNPLAKIADPVFLGYHHTAGSEMSTKVVRRENIEEKVGVYVTIDGKESILEYSDLGGKHMGALDGSGNILYWGGNTAIHVVSLSFVKRLNSHGFALPYHRAQRSVETRRPDGALERIEGWKFETFVFDAIPFAEKTCCIEVAREEEFSPVKNSDGVDSPRTASLAMSDLFTNWLEEAGVAVSPGVLVEISPLFAADKEQLALRLKGGAMAVHETTYFGD
jgi:UDP-N-acetylglucosamine/UDP-N-acetylgalactosamine diphosphorylase